MGLAALIKPFAWHRYSKKLSARIDCPRWYGTFSAEDASERGVRLVMGFDGDIEAGNAIRFYWLVDVSDGVIADLKYQVFGQSALIGAAEVACELIVGKNYDQAKRLTSELIDRHVRDKTDVRAFPQETEAHLELVIGACEQAAKQCFDIPLSDHYVTPLPDGTFGEVLEGGYPGWDEMSSEKRRALIEQVLDKEIRPYIEMDAGGVEIVDLVNGNELLIAYKGSCTSCMSSVGATLSTIQQILRNRVHPSLVVTPEIGTMLSGQ
jgi:NifU-like protein